MRLIVLALLLISALSTTQAYPLQGGDRNATVTLFGATRTPLADENTTDEILKVDVGLWGAENATYQLVDAKDKVYSPGLYKSLSSGRQIVYFLIPQDSLFKFITVTPSGKKSININWWATPKAINKDVIIRYYGISDWLINPDEQGIVLQLRVTNNGTTDLYITPQNFTLLDQWGWIYYPSLGFDPEVIAPKKAQETRVLLGYTPISLLSRPAALAYDYMKPSQIIVDLEKDQGQLSDAVVYGANATKGSTSVQSPSPAAPVLAATNQTQDNKPPANKTTVTKINSLKERVAASQARLADTRADLDKSTQDATSNSSSNSSSNSTSSKPA